jgi:hypothetical protein
VATKSESIYFRAKPELVFRIKAEAEAMGVSRSAFCRMLVQQGMGDPTSLIVLKETYYRYQSVSRRLIARAVTMTNENLAAMVDEELSAVPASAE